MVEIASLKHVSKVYAGGVTALQDVSFQLFQGESVALLGPNGAGKTTAIKILSGLLSATNGQVRVKEEAFFPGHKLQRIFGIALQEIGLWPFFTLDETFDFIKSLYGMPPQVNSAEILEEFDFGNWRKRRVETLSDGLKRRLNLACALIHEPEILILDEPSLGLDLGAKRAFWEYLEKFVRKKRITLLLCTHDMEEAERFGERVGILSKGKLIALDSPDKLKAEHGKRLSEVFLKVTESL